MDVKRHYVVYGLMSTLYLSLSVYTIVWRIENMFLWWTRGVSEMSTIQNMLTLYAKYFLCTPVQHKSRILTLIWWQEIWKTSAIPICICYTLKWRRWYTFHVMQHATRLSLCPSARLRASFNFKASKAKITRD